MSPPASRIGDMHVCPMQTPATPPIPHVGGPILPPCMVTVLTCGMPQARVGDLAMCVGPPDSIVRGSATVLVGGMPAARIGDSCAHGGTIVQGAPTVLIGDSASAGGGAGGGGGGGSGDSPTLPDSDQLPIWVETVAADLDRSVAVLVQSSQEGNPFCQQCAKGG